jgi:predicted transposase/invertase (TIGR01784 family)
MRSLKERYINLFTDFGFKKLFGSEMNKELLVDFLNHLLNKNAETIVDLQFLPTEQLGRSQADRKAIYDLLCKNEKGETFIVELQKAKQNHFKDRSVYYSTFPIQQQAEKGEWNFELKAVYTIGILDFIFEETKNEDKVVTKVKLTDVDTNAIFYEKLTYIYLEMPKFNKSEDELKTQFDKWLYIFKNLHKLTDRPANIQGEIFQKLFSQSEISQFNESEYQEYEESLKYYRDLKNSLDTAFDDGETKGEFNKAKEAALKMLIKKYPIEEISDITGLSIEEIHNL